MQVPPSRIAAIALLIAGIACGSDNPAGPGPGTTPTNGSMTAQVDGGAWSAAQIQAVRSGNIVSVAGSDTQLLSIGFAFVDAGLGDYTIGAQASTNASVISNLTDTWKADASRGSGTVTVTTLTADRIAGTFSFTVEEFNASLTPATRQVTNGQFDVTF